MSRSPLLTKPQCDARAYAARYLVLGSDGLFDVLPNKSISRLIGKMGSNAQKVCNELVKEVKKRPGQDDITLMVVQFRHDEARRTA